MASEGLSPSARLCTSCGLCCSGVVYDSVPFGAHEVSKVAELGLEPYEEPPGQPRFNLPCRHLQGTRCGVFDRRPEPCGAFRCELLKNFEAGELSMSEALSRVSEAKKMIDEVRPMVREAGGPITPKKWGALLDAWRANALGGRATELEALAVLQLAKLNRFLDTHFRSKDQQVVKNKD
jgi:uncharacterized protein